MYNKYSPNNILNKTLIFFYIKNIWNFIFLIEYYTIKTDIIWYYLSPKI